MCTAVLSIEPGLPILLAGIRDEMTDRAWEPPARHWPGDQGIIGGLDLVAGGTWLAVAPNERRVACVLNAIGQPAPTESRRSRGSLPLQAAKGSQLDHAILGSLDPFHLLIAEPGRATMATWDGKELAERALTSGLHFVVNSGLASDLLGTGSPGSDPAAATAPNGREHELARIRHFLPKFLAAPRPAPLPGQPVSQAWRSWLPLVNGDGFGPHDPRALIVRRDLGGGRTWGTTSVSLVALTPGGYRYDFTADPGDPDAWYPVLS